MDDFPTLPAALRADRRYHRLVGMRRPPGAHRAHLRRTGLVAFQQKRLAQLARRRKTADDTQKKTLSQEDSNALLCRLLRGDELREGSDVTNSDQEPTSFFALLRQLLMQLSSSNDRVTPDALTEAVRLWQVNPASWSIPWRQEQGEWTRLLKPALEYLAQHHVSVSFFAPLKGFIPLVQYKKRVVSWKPNVTAPDGLLAVLTDHFLNTLHEAGEPPLPEPSSAALGAAEEEASQIEDPMGQLRPVDMTADEVERVREQERHRFERPWEYFRYELTCQGKPYSVVVPPIKGYTRKRHQEMPRGRHHNQMQEDRPQSASIIWLVMDAVARFPSASGTRGDVCTSVLHSAYIRRELVERDIQTMVSGALDRLQDGKDSVVFFDSAAKRWRYRLREELKDHVVGPESVPQEAALPVGKKAKLLPITAADALEAGLPALEYLKLLKQEMGRLREMEATPAPASPRHHKRPARPRPAARTAAPASAAAADTARAPTAAADSAKGSVLEPLAVAGVEKAVETKGEAQTLQSGQAATAEGGAAAAAAAAAMRADEEEDEEEEEEEEDEEEEDESDADNDSEEGEEGEEEDQEEAGDAEGDDNEQEEA